jgi:8-oxo-dGTP pyrophosphatase MutT (NUDIX family)
MALRHVTAAGILCHDPEANRVLLAHRVVDGFWSVPGGCCEQGETLAQTALREFQEETGVSLYANVIEWLDANPIVGGDGNCMGIFYAQTRQFPVQLDAEHEEAVWFFAPQILHEYSDDLYPGLQSIIRNKCSP